MQDNSIKTRLVKFKIPGYVICPFCNKRQSFKKQKEHHKIVKDMNIEEPLLLKVNSMKR